MPDTPSLPPSLHEDAQFALTNPSEDTPLLSPTERMRIKLHALSAPSELQAAINDGTIHLLDRLEASAHTWTILNSILGLSLLTPEAAERWDAWCGPTVSRPPSTNTGHPPVLSLLPSEAVSFADKWCQSPDGSIVFYIVMWILTRELPSTVGGLSWTKVEASLAIWKERQDAILEIRNMLQAGLSTTTSPVKRRVSSTGARLALPSTDGDQGTALVPLASTQAPIHATIIPPPPTATTPAAATSSATSYSADMVYPRSFAGPVTCDSHLTFILRDPRLVPNDPSTQALWDELLGGSSERYEKCYESLSQLVAQKRYEARKHDYPMPCWGDRAAILFGFGDKTIPAVFWQSPNFFELAAAALGWHYYVTGPTLPKSESNPLLEALAVFDRTASLRAHLFNCGAWVGSVPIGFHAPRFPNDSNYANNRASEHPAFVVANNAYFCPVTDFRIFQHHAERQPWDKPFRISREVVQKYKVIRAGMPKDDTSDDDDDF